MPLSRYPRVGHALAPKMLSEILAVPLPRQRASALEPGQPFRLCDLDETAWSWFDFKTCHHLSRAIIRQVSRRLPSLPSDVATRSLPQPSSALQFDALELEVRTYNSLRHLKDMVWLRTSSVWKGWSTPQASLAERSVSVWNWRKESALPCRRRNYG